VSGPPLTCTGPLCTLALLLLTCVGLEKALGCLARHSLQVFSLRHWSGCLGLGEQGARLEEHPILEEVNIH
jgi:hypothetical protein